MEPIYRMPRADLSRDSRLHVDEQTRVLGLDEMPMEQIAIAQKEPQLHVPPSR